MAAWVRLVSQSIKAEFPSVELLSAFTCFRLKPEPSKATVQKDLHRLAMVLKLDEQKLMSQFIDVRAFALRTRETMEDKRLADFEAWVSSWRRATKLHLASGFIVWPGIVI